MEIKQWSAGLREQTRQALLSVPAAPDGRLHMKHVEGYFASIDLLDLLAGNYLLRRKGSDEQHPYADAEDVISNGWAID